MEKKEDSLFEAIALNDITKVNKLLCDGIEINTYSQDGYTPLMAATICGFKDIVELLIKFKADIHTVSKDRFGFTALHYAITEKKLEIVKVLINSGADVNAKDNWGNGTLFRATGEKNIGLFLLENNADPRMKNDSGISPLNSRAKGLEYVKEYLGLIDVDSEETNYFTLYDAAKYNDIRALKRLIADTSNIDDIDQDEGKTALHAAIESDHIEVIKLLLNAKANVNACDRYNGTPLMLAVSLEAVKLLLQYDANLHSKDKFENTALDFLKKNSEIAEFLKKNGA